MSKATESMFDGKNVLIPLEEVSYVLKFQNCIEVRFKDSADSLTLVQPDKNAFISAWCRYRGEVEADTLMDLDGAQPAPSVPATTLAASPEATGAEFSEDQWWFMELLAAAEQPGASLDLRRAVFGVVRRMISDMEKVRSALHHISLCSQNSASSKGECGRIARAALTRSDENSSTSPGGRAAGPTASDLP